MTHDVITGVRGDKGDRGHIGVGVEGRQGVTGSPGKSVMKGVPNRIRPCYRFEVWAFSLSP